MSHSIYLADKLNDFVLKGVAYTPPTDVYIALFTSVGGLDNNTVGEQTEVVGNAYDRLFINNVALAFTTSVSKISSNNEDWEFLAATGAWGTLTHIAIMDAATLGNVLYWGVLSTPTIIGDTNVFRLLAGALDSVYN